MIKFLLGGAIAAAVTFGGAASAQTAKPAKTAAHRAPMKDEARADVQANVAKMFARLDTNHDGFITAAEVDALEAQRSQKVKARAERFDPSKMFDRLDSNHDGKITPAEETAAHNQRVQAKGGKPVQATATALTGLFARADANKDAAVTRAEFDAMGEKLKTRIEKAAEPRGFGARLLTAADTNEDGKVSLAEEQQVALAHFDRADLNHDGKLTAQERQQARQARKQARANKPAK